MTGYTVHTGASQKFVEGWDRIFKGSKSAKSTAAPGTAKKSTAKKQAASKTRKKAT